MSDTRFARTRVLLDLVMKGQSVGEQVWADAKREIDGADPILTARSGLTVQSDGGKVEVGDIISALGELFMVMERFIHDSRAAGHMKTISSKDGDTVLAARAILNRLNYIPAPNTHTTLRGRRG